MTDPAAARRLCAAIVLCALKDAEGRNGADRVEAIAWLASSRATVFFDLMDRPQSSLLMKSDWRKWADEVIGVIPYEQYEKEISVIAHTHIYLEELEARQYANQETEDRL